MRAVHRRLASPVSCEALEDGTKRRWESGKRSSKNVGVAINRGGACHCTVTGQGPSSTDATHVKTSA